MADKRQVMVRYRIKPAHGERNEELVRAVYRELEQTRPDGLRYATFKLEDGVTFVHMAVTQTEDGRSPLVDLDAFAAFQSGLRERCDEPPTFTEIEEIGSFGWLGSADRAAASSG